ncbi:MAG TPA: flagellar biosynthesis regulator FlaF [Candidatus Cybelea sp.]|jgi:flagellar protein FlaF|nr:flagellar biosynthesis regulator FlaF [Candidatus Cybelea sp.]
MSLQKYQAVQRTTEHPRHTEYRLFAQVTRALMDSKDKSGPQRIDALDWNRRMWLTLQSDLADDRNKLPTQLKASLISLSIWVDKHTSKAMTGNLPVEPLIAINRSIMEGLASANAGARTVSRSAA